jgi:hypothetical protein
MHAQSEMNTDFNPILTLFSGRAVLDSLPYGAMAILSGDNYIHHAFYAQQVTIHMSAWMHPCAWR